MAEVLKPMTLRASRRQWQHRILAVQRLNRRLFIHAEHCRMLRGIQIETYHIGSLGFELGIVGSNVSLKPVWFDSVLGPDASHRHVRNVAKLGSQLTRRPVRRSIRRLSL